ncbi:MAG: hypothetical protein ACI82A_000642 [Candidatus Azotimanducaceae bacterium]|jgi:hypothetical protein
MTEDDFYQRWCGVAADQNPSDMVRLAGALATSPGQIFVSGYQAAIRDTFPELQHNGWVCFAVTEDRKPEKSPDSVLPGVTVKDGKVTGFKTWIAAASKVDVLVLKVGNGDGAVYGTVSAKDAEVVISLRASGFLADMSQGTAEFRGAAFTPLADSSRVRDFRRSEPFYIYLALLARLSALGVKNGAKNGAEIRECADLALKEQSEAPDLVKLDQVVSELLTMIDRDGVTLGDHWDIDRRLFTMYSKGIKGA